MYDEKKEITYTNHKEKNCNAEIQCRDQNNNRLEEDERGSNNSAF